LGLLSWKRSSSCAACHICSGFIPLLRSTTRTASGGRAEPGAGVESQIPPQSETGAQDGLSAPRLMHRLPTKGGEPVRGLPSLVCISCGWVSRSSPGQRNHSKRSPAVQYELVEAG